MRVHKSTQKMYIPVTHSIHKSHQCTDAQLTLVDNDTYLEESRLMSPSGMGGAGTKAESGLSGSSTSSMSSSPTSACLYESTLAIFDSTESVCLIAMSKLKC